MSLRTQVFKGAFALAAGRGLGDLCSFARNIIVARLLTPTDVGIGATFWITVALLQMISDLASDRLLIQAKDGDEPRFQDTLHLWEFGRGLLNSLLLFGLAWPMAYLFKAPQALWAFQCIALVPLLRGLGHLDLRRLHRHLRYRPQVSVELFSQVVALALVYPLCQWRGDYSAVLAVVLLQESVRTLGTYVVAERRYRWAWSGPHARRLLAFGWPLLANGLLLFAIMKGDRLIVGAVFSTHDLGLYAMAFTLANAPFFLLGAILNPLALPLLSAVQDLPAAFQRRVGLCNAVFALVAGVAGIPLFLSAPWLLQSVYGAQYADAAGVFAWLVAARMLWFLRLAPTTAAMARSDTKNALIANVFRLTGVILVIIAAALRFPLVTIALATLLGECCALLASAMQLRRQHGVPLSPMVAPLQVLFVVMGVAALLRVVGYCSTALGTIGLTAVLVALYCGVLLLTIPSLNAELRCTACRVKSRAGGVLVRLGASRVWTFLS